MKFLHVNKQILVAFITVCVLLTGCASETNAYLATQKPSSKASQGNSKRHSLKQDTKHKKMNFKQIQAGDYSSLIGTWKEVAYADNPFDGSGSQWHAVKPGVANHTLSVSTNKIVYNHSAMVMHGNKITDKAGSHLLSFAKDKGSLSADFADANTAINWAVTFYQKGIGNDIEPNNGVKIDNTKNLIDIWYSGMQEEIIFAQTK